MNQTMKTCHQASDYQLNPPSSTGCVRGAFAGAGAAQSSELTTAAAGFGNHESAGAGAAESRSPQPPALWDGASQPESEAIAEAAVAVPPQLNDSGRGGRGGLPVTDAIGASETKSPQPADDADNATAGDSPQPKEAGRGGT